MNQPITEERSKEFANALLTANDPDEVHSILKTLDAELGDDGTEWRPLGGEENNYVMVYSQAANPMSSFAELPMNAADAQMLKFYEHNAPDDVGPMEYTSMHDAVEADWVDVDEAEIEILTDGEKATEGNIFNLTVRNNGKGKQRGEFEDFVDPTRGGLKKQGYGFLQGLYSMGSDATLQFCGNIEDEYNDRCFKFIASASTEAKGEWTWTVLRNNPHEGQFEYLTFDGEFPTFDGTFGDALADKFRENYPDKWDLDTYAEIPEPQAHGTFVKLYDYRTRASRTQLSPTESWGRLFERYIVDSPFPITLTDIRYGSKVPQTRTSGFVPKLEGHEHLIAGEEQITIDTDSESLGQLDARVILFKDDDELDDDNVSRRGKMNFVQRGTKAAHADTMTGIQNDHAVMMTVDGRAHGSLGTDFLKRLGYARVADDTVVIVNLNDLADSEMARLFSPSRDSLNDSPQKKRLVEALEDALENCSLIAEEEERRRAKYPH